MFELTIHGVTYPFQFGMGFLREINRRVDAPIEGLDGVKKNIGLQYMLANVIDGDLEALVDILEAANKGMSPRVTRNLLDDYIDDEGTDVDALFKDVLDFLANANATKKTVAALRKAVAQQKAEK